MRFNTNNRSYTTHTTWGEEAKRALPPGNIRHKGDVVTLYHMMSKSLEERVLRRYFERRPNQVFKHIPTKLNETQVSEWTHTPTPSPGRYRCVAAGAIPSLIWWY